MFFEAQPANTPKTYRHMNGYGSHTFSLINAQGERVWCKFHFKTIQGIENFTAEEAIRVKGEDPDHATRDLFEAIARGDYPKWRVCIQVMTEEQAVRYQDNPFDPALDLGNVKADRYDHRAENDDYTQAGDLYRLMTPD
ncbi:catalase [Scytonema sp. UIC 10036]|uniref:catalase n=1 Tax=Scytonema sp. UIC 10036 TaxID=2304196 RepID=UPI0012DAA894|nr:catalase [Scytonema sp. UIC 10036]MUG98072.1 catalase [Scytonema sp. UIC 10036]